MKLIKFRESNVVFGENQPEYIPLPAHINQSDSYGTVTCCWELSWLERLKVLFSGKIWQQILTFKNSLQPQLLQTNKPKINYE